MSEIKKNDMATVSLVLGIVSIPTFFMDGIGVILAIIFAIVAKIKLSIIQI